MFTVVVGEVAPLLQLNWEYPGSGVIVSGLPLQMVLSESNAGKWVACAGVLPTGITWLNVLASHPLLAVKLTVAPQFKGAVTEFEFEQATPGIDHCNHAPGVEVEVKVTLFPETEYVKLALTVVEQGETQENVWFPATLDGVTAIVGA